MNKKFTKIAAFASAMVLTFSATSVAYAVEGKNSTETTATTETKASVSGNPVVDYGDLTKDGAVDSKDAIKVLQFYAEKILDKDLTIDKFLSGDSEETTESTEAVTATTDNTEATTAGATEVTTAVTENTTDATEAATTTDGPKVQFNGVTEASTESTDANTEASTSTSTETSTESTEASTDASTEATTEKTYSIGDVNGDGEVDTKDAILILQYYADSIIGNVETTVATESTEAATTVATEVSTGSTEATTTAVTEATTVATESTEAATTTSAE